MTTPANTIKNYCSRCCNINNHQILFKEEVHSPENEYECKDVYYTVKCLGCETVSFRQDFYDYEATINNEAYGDYVPITTVNYPFVLENHRMIDDPWSLPNSIRTVYLESIGALKANCKLLAGAGFRAVIEAVCQDKNIKGRNLEIQIDNLAKNGLITKTECSRLHTVRFLGNDSIHEMKVPTDEQLKLVLNIIEHLIKNIYLIDRYLDKALDTPITTFEDFKKILHKKLLKLNIGDELPLIKILEKDIRRVKEHFELFEKELLKEIKEGKYLNLKDAGAKPFGISPGKLIHHFIVEKVPTTPFRVLADLTDDFEDF